MGVGGWIDMIGEIGGKAEGSGGCMERNEGGGKE